jgi:uncharacterized protein (TIGR00369 family)
MGITVTQVGAGSATLTMPASPWLDHGDGHLDMIILLQEALAFAVLTSAPAASQVVAASLSVNHLRPAVLEGQSFIARARVVHGGARFTVAEVLVEDAQGRAVTHGSGSFLVRPLDPAPPPASAASVVDEPVYATPDPHLRPLPATNAPTLRSVEEDGWLAATRKMVAGQLPMVPVGQLLGLRMAEVDEGRGVIALRTSNWLRCRSFDEVASGVVAALGRDAMGLSGATLCPTSHLAGILESNLSFLRPAPIDGQELLARAHVSYEAGGLLISTGEVVDADGNVVAVGRQTALRIERRRRTSPGAEPERVLATVLFTDIVGSTRRAEELGDAAWGRLLASHHDAVRSQLEIWKGKEVKTTGDGFLATFDSPARAVQCARAVRDVVHRLGLEIRAGIHTGECEVTKTDVAGIAVHVAARIQTIAEPGQILVSSMVRDLVAGSGLCFFGPTAHELKGIEGEWQLCALEE